MIIDSIRNYIRKCPYLNKFEGAVRVNVNYLDNNATSYSIEETPTNPLVKQYLNGDSLNEYKFIFCSREFYSSDVLQNINNSGFYEEFANWIYSQNLNRNFPILDKNCECIEIKTISSGYAFQVAEDKARYQIELSIKYYKKKEV